MIILHQTNVGAFAGNHVFYWPTQPLMAGQISITSAPPTIDVFESTKATLRNWYAMARSRNWRTGTDERVWYVAPRA